MVYGNQMKKITILNFVHFFIKNVYCQSNYILSEDEKCTFTDNCIKVENGICISCKNNFYLGLDHICNSVEHYIYSNILISSHPTHKECELDYYYNINTKQCLNETEIFKNCKYSDYNGIKLVRCNGNFYL